MNETHKGYVDNIEKLTLENENFREVLYTDKKTQLVVMSIKPGEEIGMEVHQVDQFLRCEAGSAKVILDGVESGMADGTAVIVPAGTEHNIINTGSDDLKLYTLYSPPNHKTGTIHKTKADAEADEGEHFDGKTSE